MSSRSARPLVLLLKEEEPNGPSSSNFSPTSSAFVGYRGLLEARGFAVAYAPVLSFRRCGMAELGGILRVGPGRWHGGVVLTSPRAASAAVDAMAELGDPVLQAKWRKASWYTVGASTAAPLLRSGVNVVISGAGSARVLAEEMLALPVFRGRGRGERPAVLFLRGNKGLDVLPNALGAEGVPVTQLTVYQTVPDEQLTLPRDYPRGRRPVSRSSSGANDDSGGGGGGGGSSSSSSSSSKSGGGGDAAGAGGSGFSSSSPSSSAASSLVPVVPAAVVVFSPSGAEVAKAQLRAWGCGGSGADLHQTTPGAPTRRHRDHGASPPVCIVAIGKTTRKALVEKHALAVAAVAATPNAAGVADALDKALLARDAEAHQHQLEEEGLAGEAGGTRKADQRGGSRNNANAPEASKVGIPIGSMRHWSRMEVLLISSAAAFCAALWVARRGSRT